MKPVTNTIDSDLNKHIYAVKNLSKEVILLKRQII